MDRRHALRIQPLPRRRIEHTIAHESGERFLIEMLQLAAPAAAEVAARWIGAMRTRLHGPVRQNRVPWRRQRNVAAGCGYAVTLGGDADDRFCFGHSAAA